MKLIILASMTIAMLSVKAKTESKVDKVIYGKDNRIDYYQIKNKNLKSMANATVALMESYDLDETANHYQLYNPSTIGEDRNLCTSEPFYNQPVASFCSGFLVNNRTIVTAGHCVANQFECESKKFVFGYHTIAPGKVRTRFSKNFVFGCKKLVGRQEDEYGADWAVIVLDRPVKYIKPLKLSKIAKPNKGDSLFVIGYPSGLPLKVAGGAKVRSLSKAFFNANLDTYGGNSGSPVFNASQKTVQGILVRGETDYENSPNFCRVSYQCTNNDCRGEDVTYINEICKGTGSLCKTLGIK